MFTGIVEETGKIKNVKKGTNSAVLTIQAKEILEDVKIGDSIAVNGVCLTVTSYSKDTFTVDVMHETLNRSSLKSAISNCQVNLERAMPAQGRFGGHIVSGHIDGTGVVLNIEEDDNAIWYTIKAEPRVLRYIVEKGSIAIDGVSLTVAKVTDEYFKVSLIPHTRKITTFSTKKKGDVVNLETDCIAKYVEKLLRTDNTVKKEMFEGSNTKKESGIVTSEFLAEHGFL